MATAHGQIAAWLEQIHDNATHVDVFFMPVAGCFPVLGWAPDAAAIELLLTKTVGGLGKPTTENVVEYRADEAVMLRSMSADVAPRIARLVPIREQTSGYLFARELRVTTLSPHAFPSKNAYDSVRAVARSRWNLHHRVKLHVDATDSEATVYLRYNHSNNVDSRAMCAILSRGIAALASALYA